MFFHLHAGVDNEQRREDVTAETSRRICCDSSISTLVKGKSDEPLSIGRKSRVIPPAMRRALKARDKNCRFPGCTHQYSIDGHHIKHWSAGDETGQTMPSFNGNIVVKLKERCEDWHIHARSCVTHWLGERMDLNLAVGHLWQADRTDAYP